MNNCHVWGYPVLVAMSHIQVPYKGKAGHASLVRAYLGHIKQKVVLKDGASRERERERGRGRET